MSNNKLYDLNAIKIKPSIRNISLNVQRIIINE